MIPVSSPGLLANYLNWRTLTGLYRHAIFEHDVITRVRRNSRAGKNHSDKIQGVCGREPDLMTGAGAFRSFAPKGAQRFDSFRQRELLADESIDKPSSANFPLKLHSPVLHEQIAPRWAQRFPRQQISKHDAISSKELASGLLGSIEFYAPRNKQ